MNDYINSRGETVCGKCGEVILSGRWPFCPHPPTGNQATGINRDEIPGGITLENYGPNPVTFYSHSERRAYMVAHGLQEREKFAPMPGTDIDPAGIPNPAGYMDPQTLENARVLLSRNGQRETPADDTTGFIPIEPHIAGTREKKRLRAALKRQ